MLSRTLSLCLILVFTHGAAGKVSTAYAGLAGKMSTRVAQALNSAI